jgi:hypothetical protein
LHAAKEYLMDVVRQSQSGAVLGLGSVATTASASRSSPSSSSSSSSSSASKSASAASSAASGGAAAPALSEEVDQHLQQQQQQTDVASGDGGKDAGAALPPNKTPFYTFTDYVKDAKQQLGCVWRRNLAMLGGVGMLSCCRRTHTDGHAHTRTHSCLSTC